ncbi:MAG TPA: sulfotransferase [Rhodopila sp.]|jgi:hypothetical protein|nr:sulfotransferase [Rhodopila sp.]
MATSPQAWIERQEALLRLLRMQLFFVGGAPRSGTTWLQYLLDSHPEVSCRGEGLFSKHLAEPLEAMAAARRDAIAAKNGTVFSHGDGYPLPEPDDTEFLLGTGVLLALDRQGVGRTCRAIGEKTPENVFFFERIKRLFPNAKFIGIARDPRDVLASAWHFFHQPRLGHDDVAAKTAFISSAFPSLNNGARTMLALTEQFPADCITVTYEQMRESPAPVAAELFRFLGVADDDAVVADCVARSSFTALSGGRTPGVAQEGSFFRSGISGGWRSTFSPEMNAMILDALGWMFPRFGWTA